MLAGPPQVRFPYLLERLDMSYVHILPPVNLHRLGIELDRLGQGGILIARSGRDSCVRVEHRDPQALARILKKLKITYTTHNGPSLIRLLGLTDPPCSLHAKPPKKK